MRTIVSNGKAYECVPLRRPGGEAVAGQRQHARCQEGLDGASSRVKMNWLEASQRTATQRLDDTGRGEPWVRCHSQVGIFVPEASEPDQQFGGGERAAQRICFLFFVFSCFFFLLLFFLYSFFSLFFSFFLLFFFFHVSLLFSLSEYIFTFFFSFFILCHFFHSFRSFHFFPFFLFSSFVFLVFPFFTFFSPLFFFFFSGCVNFDSCLGKYV